MPVPVPVVAVDGNETDGPTNLLERAFAKAQVEAEAQAQALADAQEAEEEEARARELTRVRAQAEAAEEVRLLAERQEEEEARERQQAFEREMARLSSKATALAEAPQAEATPVRAAHGTDPSGRLVEASLRQLAEEAHTEKPEDVPPAPTTAGGEFERRLSDEDGSPMRRDTRLSDEDGSPMRRDTRLSDEDDSPMRRDTRLSDEDGSLLGVSSYLVDETLARFEEDQVDGVGTAVFVARPFRESDGQEKDGASEADLPTAPQQPPLTSCFMAHLIKPRVHRRTLPKPHTIQRPKCRWALLQHPQQHSLPLSCHLPLLCPLCPPLISWWHPIPRWQQLQAHQLPSPHLSWPHLLTSIPATRPRPHAAPERAVRQQAPLAKTPGSCSPRSCWAVRRPQRRIPAKGMSIPPHLSPPPLRPSRDTTRSEARHGSRRRRPSRLAGALYPLPRRSALAQISAPE